MEKIYPFLEQVFDENSIALRRKKFFSLVGDIYENEDFYHERINAFLEWLLTEADIQKNGRPVLSFILDRGVSNLDEETRRIAEAMIKSRRSVFMLVRKETEFAVLEDIFDKDRFFVDPDPRIENTDKKSLVETRVCFLDGRSRIMSTYLKYPENIKKILLKRLRKMGGTNMVSREKFIDYSFALFVRNERYRNIPVEKIAESLDYLLAVN
ncbi:MAG: hypothetical protein N3B13_05805 [Deltaproteobacteria bacterium]|nr:hypothetical protein [Deltaproteobacteria bacterium]